MFSKTINKSAYAYKTDNTEQVEDPTQLESDEEENLKEGKLYQPKEYMSIANFAFKEFKSAVSIACLISDLHPSHHEILERPPKKKR